MGMIAVGLVILFVGMGEKGFKTKELHIIGPSLISSGFIFCFLRILFCHCPFTFCGKICCKNEPQPHSAEIGDSHARAGDSGNLQRFQKNVKKKTESQMPNFIDEGSEKKRKSHSTGSVDTNITEHLAQTQILEHGETSRGAQTSANSKQVVESTPRIITVAEADSSKTYAFLNDELASGNFSINDELESKHSRPSTSEARKSHELGPRVALVNDFEQDILNDSFSSGEDESLPAPPDYPSLYNVKLPPVGAPSSGEVVLSPTSLGPPPLSSLDAIPEAKS